MQRGLEAPRSCPVAVTTDAEPVALLDAALDALGLPAPPPANREPGGVAILVDLGAFDRESPVLPDRRLVERLVDRLAALGWSDVAVASSADSSSTWADNRDVYVLAELFGYAYETAAGTPYDVVDLSDDLIDGGLPPGSVLAGTPLAARWRDAALRIVLAKAATDQREGIVLGAHALLSALPVRDKDAAYRLAMDPADALAALLDRAAPHLAVVDLCGIAHGSGGRTAPRRAATRAVVAGADLLAVDAAAAAKLGADPALSPLWAGLAARRGLPIVELVCGQLAPLPGVHLPDPVLVEATRARDRSPVFARLVPPWLQARDAASFPLKHPLDTTLHEALAARLARPDDDPLARMILVVLNQACAALGFWIEAWRANHDKDRVAQRRAGISPATLACTDADYRAMEAELGALESWLGDDADLSPDRPLRWRKVDGAVVFRYARVFPVPFAAFTARVDIARTIQLMNDYIGGTILVVARDARGRPVRQVERNLYLPQPNYLAWWGGMPIDVSKIEDITWGTHRQRMLWKTIVSENASATYDDGVVRFEAAGPAATRVSIVGRQRFALPPVVEAMHVERYPDLEAQLIDRAYTSFFSRTFANFDALLDGRSIAIGTPAAALTADDAPAPRPIEALADMVARLADALSPLLQAMLPAPPPAGASRGEVDADGFVHFRPGAGAPPDRAAADPLRWWQDFAAGYAEAVLRDLGSRPAAA